MAATDVPENTFCKCGKKSVVFDPWFCYYPCLEHSNLTPTQYNSLNVKETDQ